MVAIIGGFKARFSLGGNVFETDETEVAATVDAAGATVRATDWATHFYEDLLHIVDCEFRNKPTRFWLITFA
jgi:hypothetical protein